MAKSRFAGSIENQSFLFNRYWRAVYCELHALSVIVKVLSAYCATEAAAERIFSVERIVHSDLRNRMKPNLVSSILTIRCNQEFVNFNKKILNLVHSQVVKPRHGLHGAAEFGYFSISVLGKITGKGVSILIHEN